MSSAPPASVASLDATQTPAPPARGSDPPKLSGGLPWLGHLLELRRRPIALMQRVRDECGEIGEFNLAGHRVVLLTGEEGNEAFFARPTSSSIRPRPIPS